MDKIYPEEHIQAIANAIRRKNGKSVNYLTSEMAGAIDQLVSYPEPTGTQTITENGIVDVKDKAYADVNVQASATLISKTITANGEYDAEDDEADGYSDVTVNVPNSYSASDEGKVVSSGALVAQTSTTKTANGTYDTTENNEVVVAVENSYVAADEGKVVSNGALIAQTSVTKTQNGTYDTTLNNEVVINVSGGGGSTNILSGTDAPTANQGSDGDVYLQTIFAPTGAKRVEYIESSGTQWIDTLFTPDQDSGIELDLIPVRKYGSYAGQGWCDVSVSTSSNRFGILADYGEGKIQFNYNTYHYSSTFSSGNRYKVALLKNKAYINGSLVDTYTETTISTSATLPLFSSRYNSSNPNRPSATKLYSCKIWDDDTLVRNFIPVLDVNDVACLYDCVNGTYYYNQGTDDFSYGAELLDGEITAAYCKVNGTWQDLIGTDIDDVNTGE